MQATLNRYSTTEILAFETFSTDTVELFWYCLVLHYNFGQVNLSVLDLPTFNEYFWDNLTPKRLGCQLDPCSSCSFSRNMFSREEVKPWFFPTYNIIINHAFPENFTVISQVVQNMRIFSFKNNYFDWFLGLFLTISCWQHITNNVSIFLLLTFSK